MLVFGSHSRQTFPCAVLLLVLALAGCGNSCFVGFSNNGTGVVLIKVSNPPPSCSLNQVNAMVRVIAVKATACEACKTPNSQEHAFLTLRGIQLRSADGQNTPAWLEIAPQLAKEPRQVDLTASRPDILAEHATIPAGTYGELRLQFLSESPGPDQSLPIENRCRDKGWNCLIAEDGHIEPIRQEELVMELGSAPHIPFQLLPDSSVDLQVNLGLSPSALYLSDAATIRLQTIVVGHATTIRPDPTPQPPSNSD
jgi:hypothetical protein